MDRSDIANGGFVANNTGEIQDCYCVYTSPSKGKRHFSGKNSGSIKSSFATDRKNLMDARDGSGELFDREIRNSKEAGERGFDTDRIWRISGNRLFLKFQDANWLESVDANGRKPTLIGSYQELVSFAGLVNSGDEKAQNANIRLTADIDCGRHRMLPIGADRQSAFQGIFDGAGFGIRNFWIEGEHTGNYGLFGYLKGEVYNLSVDCIIKAKGNIGAICGINEGRISCCGVVVDLSGDGDRLYMGGLCGQNHGLIDKSYAAVRTRRIYAPIIPIALAASFFMLIGVVATLMIPRVKAIDQTYAPIEREKDQKKIETEEAPSDDAVNRLSFRFNQNLHIDPSDGKCYLDFQNPSYASHKVVLRLEAEEGEQRRVIASSDTIDPGYGLSYLRLNQEGYRLVNGGLEEGYIVITPYDAQTDDRSMVDSELPVRITIE